MSEWMLRNLQKEGRMTTENKPREILWCSWCKKISYKNSENGYCQKCFEAKLISFCEKQAYDLLTAELEAVKKENEGYRKYVTGGPDGLAHMIEAYEELKKIWNSGHDKLKDNLDLAVKGLEKIQQAKCPSYVAHPQTVWWREHVQSVAIETLAKIMEGRG